MFVNINGKDIPEYCGKPFIKISSGTVLSEYKKKADFFVMHNKLGDFILCGREYPIYTAYACIDSKHISKKRRNGNKNKNMPDFFYKTYDFIKGKYLYNNCHLIGYQLCGDKTKENLIIGTRYMNEIGMLHFEKMVADYVKSTGNHVLYRVTPVFNEDEQLIKGVQIEAYSLEDKGTGICFNVFIYNVQPGVSINYKNGDSKEVIDWYGKMFSQNNMYTNKEKGTQNYILNTDAHKFHNPDCNLVDQMNDENKKEFKYPRQFLLDNGYKPCKNCKP